jgi:S1-C subfamily serine protease
LDYNLFTNAKDLEEVRRKYKTDAHSVAGDPQFIDPAHGDYRVREGSPALSLGFKNFPMDQFGVVSPRLKAIAKTPELPILAASTAAKQRDGRMRAWLGAKVRNVLDEGEMSVYGLPGVTGVLVLEVPAESAAGKAGLRKNDVIVKFDQTEVNDIREEVRESALAPSTNFRMDKYLLRK